MVALSPATWIALLLAVPAIAADERSWEVNGIRLESGQVERLADELAERTVTSVEHKVEGIALTDEQRPRMRTIYRGVALDVYEDVIEVIERDDLDEDARRAEVRELVLAGQRHSSEMLRVVLDERQMELYRVWAAAQVESFRSRRLDARRRRRRR